MDEKNLRLNHYYPAAILAIGHAQLIKKDKRKSKINCINTRNLSKFVNLYIKSNSPAISVIDIYSALIIKEEHDRANGIPHKQRILSEINVDLIFTDKNLMEFESNKEEEIRIGKIERDFRDFLLELLPIKKAEEIYDLLEEKKEIIINFTDLTIDRVPFFNKDTQIKCKNLLKIAKIYSLNIDINLFIMSDLLPLVPIDYSQIKEFKEYYEKDLISDIKFPITNEQLDILKDNDLLLFPITKNCIIIFGNDIVLDALNKDNLLETIIKLYNINSLIFAAEYIIYNKDYELFVIRKLINLYLSTDIEKQKNKFKKDYEISLHSEVK